MHKKQNLTNCSYLILSNGGKYKTISIRNTCSIDYFLIIIFIVYNNHRKYFNEELVSCFNKIHRFITLNYWNFARFEWLNFSELTKHIVIDNTHDWFLSEYQSFYSTYGKYQSYSWKFLCSNGNSCRNHNRCETSNSFIFKFLIIF